MRSHTGLSHWHLNNICQSIPPPTIHCYVRFEDMTVLTPYLDEYSAGNRLAGRSVQHLDVQIQRDTRLFFPHILTDILALNVKRSLCHLWRENTAVEGIRVEEILRLSIQSEVAVGLVRGVQQPG